MRRTFFLLILLGGIGRMLAAQPRYPLHPGNPDTRLTYSPYQNSSSGLSPGKLFVGGNLGLIFGTNYTNVDISPLIGYHVTDWFAAGVNFNFDLVSEKGYTDASQSYTTLGGGIFMRFYPVSQFYAQIQPEYNRYSIQVKSGSSIIGQETHNVASLLMGGGYVQQISPKVSLTFGIFYDVLQNIYSPYFRQPVFQGGINLGL